MTIDLTVGGGQTSGESSAPLSAQKSKGRGGKASKARANRKTGTVNQNDVMPAPQQSPTQDPTMPKERECYTYVGGSKCRL
jgi:hypothetical protein